MSAKERIKIVRDAISSVKHRQDEYFRNGQLIEFSNLAGDLFDLERCLEIEIDLAIRDRAMSDFENMLENAS